MLVFQVRLAIGPTLILSQSSRNLLWAIVFQVRMAKPAQSTGDATPPAQSYYRAGRRETLVGPRSAKADNSTDAGVLCGANCQRKQYALEH